MAWTPELQAQYNALRAQGLSDLNIAESYGVNPADVAAQFGSGYVPTNSVTGQPISPAPQPMGSSVYTPPAPTPAQSFTPDQVGTSYNFGANQLGMLGIDPSLISRGYEDLNMNWQGQQSHVPRQNPDGSWTVYQVKEVTPGQFQALSTGITAATKDAALAQTQEAANKSSGFIDDLLTTAAPFVPLAVAGLGAGGYLGGGSAFGTDLAALQPVSYGADGYWGSGLLGGDLAGAGIVGSVPSAAGGVVGSAAGGTLGGATTAGTAAATTAASTLPTMVAGGAAPTPSWLTSLTPGLVTGGAQVIGGVLQNQTNQKIADQNNANIAAQNENAKFRPVGVTTRFGQSQFGYDANGRLTSAGYNLNPDVKMLQDRQIGMVGGLQGDWERAVQLGRGAMKTPEQYMQEQLGLLSPTREQGLAAIRNQAQQTGRMGLATGGTSTTMATNPEMAAYYNAIQQENARLAANAPQQSLALANQGLGLMSQGYQPLQTAIGAITGLEQLGQQTMDLGTTIGGQQSTANARLQTPQVPNQVNPWTAGLMGGVNAYQQYQNRQPVATTQNPYVPGPNPLGLPDYTNQPDYSQLQPGYNGYGDNPWGDTSTFGW